MQQALPPSDFDIKSQYDGKCVFITGATGFLAKVVLEKLLFSCHGIKKIYCLIRGKKNLSPMDRLNKDVFSGICFNRLRKTHGEKEFNQLISTKIEAIGGDVTQPRLGISDFDYQTLKENVNMIIHCAADVGFENTAHHMFRINYYGGLEALNLAKQCKNMSCYTYVSTFSAACDQQQEEYVQEKLYFDGDHLEDPKKMIDELMQMPTEMANKKCKKLQGLLPFNYMLTKKLAEQSTVLQRGHVPVVIARPGVVINSLYEPFPYYVDSVQSFQGINHYVGTGQFNYLVGKQQDCYDLIPVDIVSNQLIAMTAYKSYRHQVDRQRCLEQVEIYHQVSSGVNPCNYKLYEAVIKDTYQTFRLSKQVYPVDFQILPEMELNMKKSLYNDLPLYIAKTFAQFPTLSSQKFKQSTQEWIKASDKQDKIHRNINPCFVLRFSFASNNIYKVIDDMSLSDRREFPSDVKVVDWKSFVKNAIINTAVHLFQEDHIDVVHGFDQLMNKQGKKEEFKAIGQEKSTAPFEAKIAKVARFQEHIQAKTVNFMEAEKDLQQLKTELERVRCGIKHTNSEDNFKLLNRTFDHLLDGIFVNSSNLERFQRMTQTDEGARILFVPVQKSFMDPFVMFYINQMTGLDHGFMFGNNGDVPTARFISDRLKKMGVILMNLDTPGSFSENKDIAKYVNQNLLQETVSSNRFTTLFHNSKRNAVGKFNQKHLPDYSVRMLLAAHEDFKQRGLKVKVVPVSINYERILEGTYMTNENQGRDLLDNDRIHTFMKKLKTLPKGRVGKVIVKYLEPIDLDQYVELKQNTIDLDFSPDYGLAKQFTQDLYKLQQQEQQITMNGLICSALSQQPNGEISFSSMRQRTKTLYATLQAKNITSLISYAPKNAHIAQAVTNMGYEVVGSPYNPKLQDKAFIRKKEGQNSSITDLKLVYQTGQFEARLFKEALLANSFNLVATQNKKVTLQKMHEAYDALATIFKNEYLLFDENQANFDQVLATEVKNGLYQVKDETVTLSSNPNGRWLHDYYAHLMRKAVDSYLVTAKVLNDLKQYQATADLEVVVQGLVNASQKLYIDGSIKYLNSCISSMFLSAVGHFTEIARAPGSKFQEQVEKLKIIKLKDLDSRRLEEQIQLLSGLCPSIKNMKREVEKTTLKMSLMPQSRL